MAKILDNLVTDGLSGKIGRQLVFRNQKRQTIAAKQAVYNPNRKKSEEQLEHELRFREAVIYAKTVTATEATKAAYAKKAKASRKIITAYAVAVADYLNAPEIRKVDLSKYTGNSGEKIVVSAIDDLEVKSVTVEIRQSDDTLVENGVALIKSNGVEWEYTTLSTNALLTGSKVIVSATDLPGNVTEKETVI